MLRSLALGTLLILPLSVSPAQDVTGTQQEGPASPTVGAPKEQKTLTNDAIIRMAKAGLDEDLIAQTVRTQPGSYATGSDDLIALKEGGVSQTVISAMLAKNSGMTTHTEKPIDLPPASSQVDDIGVYYKLRETQDWQPMPIELVNFRQGGALKSTLTNGIIKKDMNGHVKGPSAKLNMRAGDQILIYTPGGTQPEEYLLLRFRQHADNREFRTETGNVFHSETGAERDAVSFQPRKIGKNMYAYEVPDLEPGEYGVLPPGNVNQRGMANAGKIYTFAIGR